jgi:HK97 family phage major capsid protein
MKTPKQIEQELLGIAEEMDALADKPDLGDEDRGHVEELITRAHALELCLSVAQRQDAGSQSAGDPRFSKLTDRRAPPGNRDDDDGEPRHRAAAGTAWRDLTTGQTVRVVGPRERFADCFPPLDVGGIDYPAGRAVIGWLTGRWAGADKLCRALQTGVGAGHLLVPDFLASQIIDLARAKAVMMRAGCQTLAMEGNTLTLARAITDPTMQFKGENNAFTEGVVNFDAVNLGSRTVGTYIVLSRELAEDAPNAPQAVETMLAGALASQLDAAMLAAGGGTAWVGLGALAGILTDGAVATYDDLIDGIQSVEEANGVPSAWITTPAIKATLSKLTGDDQYLAPPVGVAELERFVTTTCPVGVSYLGDFTQCVLGVRKGQQIELSTTAGDFFTKHQVGVKIVFRGDFNCLRPSHIIRLSA